MLEIPIIDKKTRIWGIGASAVITLGYANMDVEVDNNTYNWMVHIVNDSDIDVEILIGNDILNDVDVTITKESTNFKPKISQNKEKFTLRAVATSICDSDELYEKDIIKVEHINNIYQDKVNKIVADYKICKIESPNVQMKIIVEDDIPLYERPRRLPLTDQKIVEEQVDEWLEERIVKPSCSEYASAVVLVPKKDGSKRLCCDYRRINQKIVKDNFPMQLIDDVLAKLQGAKIFSTLDLKNGFFHVPVEVDSQKYTAFVTHHGQFEFTVMPFGMKNSLAVLCRYRTAIFHEFIRDSSVIIYMDDLIIPTRTEQENIDILKQLLEKASKNGLEISWKKCQFLKTEITFLGYIIKNSEIRPSVGKIEAVRTYAVPTDIKSLQRFLGLTSYFRRFVLNYAYIAKPLSDLLSKTAKFKFGDSQIIAFEELKYALTNAPVLKIFNPDAYTEVHTDASMHGYGAILLQKDSETQNLHPVEYMSRKTAPCESRYHSYELEVLAVIQALKKWRNYLLGIKFKIITDCDAFKGTMKKRDVPLRVTRWILFLQDFDYDIEHRSGTKMRHVDALSRVYALIARGPLHEKIDAAQNQDPWIKIAKECIKNEKNNPNNDLYIKNNLLYKNKNKDWIVIPESMEKEIIEMAHRQGHFAAKKTAEIVEKTFYIPDLLKKANIIAKSCIQCTLTEAKAGKKEGFYNPKSIAQTPLETLHVDHIGPLETTKKQYNFILTVVDSFTKFTSIYPTRSTSAMEALEKMKLHAAIFGYPKYIVTDRGVAFTSHAFRNYCTEHNINHHLITTGVPRENGQVERINKTIITILSKLCQEKKEQWYKHTDRVQQFINSTAPRSTKITPFKLLTGVDMKLTDLDDLKELVEMEIIKDLNTERNEIRDMAKESMNKLQEENRKTFNKNRTLENKYKIGDIVAIKRTQFGTGLKLKPKYLGPYKVTVVKNNGRYEVEKLGEDEGPKKTSTISEYMKPWTTAFGTNT